MRNLACTQMDVKSSFGNPFAVESPEKLTPRQIVDLFVEKYTKIETVKQRRHTFIWGSRGSGKSMMLRYLEPQCQAIVHEGIDKFIGKSDDSFLAVYCPCKEGQLNKTELVLLDQYALLVIIEHMMNLNIADRLVDCLRTKLPMELFAKDKIKTFSENVFHLFDKASIASSYEQAQKQINFPDDPLRWLQVLLTAENHKLNFYLRQTALGKKGGYEGATSGYHDFLLPMIKLVQDLFELRFPVYVLLDDADRLEKAHQSIINTWISNRDQSILCLKICARREGYKTFFTRDSGLIEQPHDFSEIDVEELYTRSKSDYFEKVKLIAERRLVISDAPTKNIEDFLPADEREEGLLEEFKKKTAEEWEGVEKPGRQGDYVTRYAVPRLFQHLKSTKQQKSYAGFKNIVHISSGVVRDFLEPCYLMFDECLSKGNDAKSIRFISPGVQNEVLDGYSKELLLMRFEDIRKDLPPERWTQLESLRTLIESLGRLFYQRLHDPEARESRLFSFTVRSKVPREIDEVLNLGVQYRYFQLSTYSTKEGGGRERWYVLNRRLCPAYKLDPTGFEGRISLTAEFLKLACRDPDEFVRRRLKAKDRQPTLFSLNEDKQDES